MINGVAFAIAHNGNGIRAPGDQPTVECRQPGNRLSRPQPVEQRVQIAFKIVYGDGSPDRKSGLFVHVSII